MPRQSFLPCPPPPSKSALTLVEQFRLPNFFDISLTAATASLAAHRSTPKTPPCTITGWRGGVHLAASSASTTRVQKHQHPFIPFTNLKSPKIHKDATGTSTSHLQRPLLISILQVGPQTCTPPSSYIVQRPLPRKRMPSTRLGSRH